MSYNREFQPFSNTSDKEFVQTTISKWINFTHINNIWKLIKENFIRKITSETNLSKYFNMPNLESLTCNKKWPCVVPHKYQPITTSFWWIGNLFSWLSNRFSNTRYNWNKLKEANPPSTYHILYYQDLKITLKVL